MDDNSITKEDDPILNDSGKIVFHEISSTPRSIIESSGGNNSTKDSSKKIRQKPPEVIKAQIAAFAEDTITNTQDRRHILNNIANLSRDNPQTVSRPITQAIQEKDDESRIVDVRSEIEKLIATKEDYINYLRTVGGSKYKSIE